MPNIRARLSALKRMTLMSAHLFARSVGAKYRRSFMGYFWMVAPPLLIGGTAALANQAGAISSGYSGLPFIVFAVIGVVYWMSFVEAFDTPYQAIDEARSYLTRVLFPREAIILARLYETLVSATVRLLMIYALCAVHGLYSPFGFLIIFAGLAGCILVGLGIGGILAPFMVLFSDLRDFTRLILSYGIFLTPAFFQPTAGLFSNIVRLHPLSPLMQGAREAIAGSAVESMPVFVITIVIGGVLTICGIGMFRLSGPIIVERMLLGGR